jgi:hypothetical protein
MTDSDHSLLAAELSDEMMGPVLDSLPAEEQPKLLLLLRRLVSKTGQAWIDKQLKARKRERSSRLSDD